MKLTSKKTTLLWIIAIAVTLGSVVYQRMTGPTHPIGGSVEIQRQRVSYKLLRSHVTTSDARIEIEVPSSVVSGQVRWRRLRSHDSWMPHELKREGEKLVAVLPKQPSAGKIVYLITLVDSQGREYDLTDEPVTIRFKDPVPLFILIPHILFMFTAMFLGTRAGLEAIAKGDSAYRLALWAAALLFLGGIVLGAVVQKFAFGAYWTGWPVGRDLTDNKTALTMILWIVAVWRARREGRGRAWIITAAVVQLAVYLIPHSTLGSELDYTKME